MIRFLHSLALASWSLINLFLVLPSTRTTLVQSVRRGFSRDDLLRDNYHHPETQQSRLSLLDGRSAPLLPIVEEEQGPPDEDGPVVRRHASGLLAARLRSSGVEDGRGVSIEAPASPSSQYHMAQEESPDGVRGTSTALQGLSTEALPLAKRTPPPGRYRVTATIAIIAALNGLVDGTVNMLITPSTARIFSIPHRQVSISDICVGWKVAVSGGLISLSALLYSLLEDKIPPLRQLLCGPDKHVMLYKSVGRTRNSCTTGRLRLALGRGRSDNLSTSWGGRDGDTTFAFRFCD